MSENALVQLDPNQAIAPAAAVNFSSRFMQTKPATLVINQPNTQAEGAIRGHLRIVEQNLQFDKMTVTLLAEPEESRAWYAGEKGQLNRTPDNLMCFSHDLQKPDDRAKVPQAMQCGHWKFDANKGRNFWVDTCPKASWEPWRTNKEKTGQKDPKLIPACEKSLKLALIDTKYRIPLFMYLRSNAKSAFEDELQQVARTFEFLKAQGKKPTWYDVQFDLSTTAIKNNNGTVSYVPKISNVKEITPEERAKFGELFLRFLNRGGPTQQQLQQSEQRNAIAEQNSIVDVAVLAPDTPPSANVVDGEIVI